MWEARQPEGWASAECVGVGKTERACKRLVRATWQPFMNTMGSHWRTCILAVESTNLTKHNVTPWLGSPFRSRCPWSSAHAKQKTPQRAGVWGGDPRPLCVVQPATDQRKVSQFAPSLAGETRRGMAAAGHYLAKALEPKRALAVFLHTAHENAPAQANPQRLL